jgi:hypothetical protein
MAAKNAYPKSRNILDERGQYVPTSYRGLGLYNQLLVMLQRETDSHRCDEERVARIHALLPRAFHRSRRNQGY